MSTHSRFSPSSAHRWIPCPGSIQAIESLETPDRTSEAAERGTQAHEVAHKILNCDIAECTDYPLLADEWEENISHIMIYVDCVTNIRNKRSDNVRMYLEHRVKIEDTSDVFGTIDALIYDPDSGICNIIDFKFGYIEVAVHNNPQLIMYAAGAIGTLNLPSTTRFVLCISQPRIEKETYIEYSYSQILEWANTHVFPAIKFALIEDPPRIAGDVQCEWCPYQSKCPEYDEKFGAQGYAKIKEVAKRQRDALDEKTRLAAEAKKTNDTIDRCSEELDTMMLEAGIDSISFPFGTAVRSVVMSVKLLDKKLGYTWLKNHNMGDLIDTAINPRTLTKNMREYTLDKGKPFPSEVESGMQLWMTEQVRVKKKGGEVNDTSVMESTHEANGEHTFRTMDWIVYWIVTHLPTRCGLLYFMTMFPHTARFHSQRWLNVTISQCRWVIRTRRMK